MSELKCPYCNKPLVDRGYYDYMCPDECYGAGNIVGNESMWAALISAKKKLDIAVDALIGIEDGVDNLYIAQVTARDALEEIEQIKDKE